MKRAGHSAGKKLIAIFVLLISLATFIHSVPQKVNAETLSWSIVDTPSYIDNVIVSPSEINMMALGPDGFTWYALDIPGDLAAGTYPDGKIYKSVDGGITWQTDISRYLIAAGARFPAWNIAVASDDSNLVVIVTDGTIIPGTPQGPKKVFISSDGGNNWTNTNFPALGAGEYISCVHISPTYGAGMHDIAIGTRNGSGNGKVYVIKTPGLSGWVNQGLNGDAVALKFSPSYSDDSGLIVISSTAAGTFLNLGDHDITSNTTTWNSRINYPWLIVDTNYTGSSPKSNEIVTADLELPSDFAASDPQDMSLYFVAIDSTAAGTQSGIYRIDDTGVNWITPPSVSGRFSSIAYFGTYDGEDSKLMAGEVTADPTTALVNIWVTSDCIATTPTWQVSDALKSPTGGGNSGYANARVLWAPDGEKAYCGTSSANPSTGGTAWAPGQWPFAWLNSVPLDESAFSISLDDGEIWNQTSLIDTEITLLSDVAIIEVPEGSELTSVIYLASLNKGAAVYNFDSIWRSTSDILGRSWERILCTNTSDSGTITRVNPRTDEEDPAVKTRSKSVIVADRLSKDVWFSPDEGQNWHVLYPDINISDLTYANENTIYILHDTSVSRGTGSYSNWIWQSSISTNLNSAHTISTPWKNPESKDAAVEFEDWVFVGDDGLGEVAYADFSQTNIQFHVIPQVPVSGTVHVIPDQVFGSYYTIYAAVNDSTGIIGKIYRWVIGQSKSWEELKPPNAAFYGIAQRNDVLYGAWNNATPPNYPPGVDRTIYPRAAMPPPIEWDDLTDGLPRSGDANYPVSFTREPTSLKISGEPDTNNLWAIDDRPYDWMNKIGCLWTYTDTFAKVGPWATSPASRDYILVDPVTGRADEINFRWRQLSYAEGYQLHLAKEIT